jgi:hypothetical protein
MDGLPAIGRNSNKDRPGTNRTKQATATKVVVVGVNTISSSHPSFLFLDRSTDRPIARPTSARRNA